MTQSIKWLQDEIAARMLQKLDIIKLVVKSVLVFPDFLGAHANFLAKRFSGLRFYSAPESSLSGFNLLRFKIVHQNQVCQALTCYGSKPRFYGAPNLKVVPIFPWTNTEKQDGLV